MRSIRRTLSAHRRPWRAIPELDGLPDEECRVLMAALVRGAGARSDRHSTLRFVGFGLLVLVLFCWWIYYLHPPLWTVLIYGVILFAMSLLPSHSPLTSKIAARLREDWCQTCAYPLHELPPSPDPIRCPRCARPCIDRESIRTAAQLLACDVEAHIARARREKQIVHACGCGYPLAGLPITDGRAQCPECGARYHPRPRGFIRELPEADPANAG